MKNTRQNIREKLNTIITDYLGISHPDRYDESASWIDYLGCDDLDWLEVIMESEDVFEIEIPELDACDQTIGTLIDLIVSLQEKQASH